MPATFRNALFTLGLAATMGAGVGASAAQADPIEISNPTLRTTIGQSDATAGYVTLHNAGTDADRLLAVRTDIARMANIHQMSQKDGVMAMAPVSGGIEIAAGATVVLAPMGLHIMVMGLEATIHEGQMVPMVLVFERAGQMTVDFNAASLANIQKAMKAMKPTKPMTGEMGMTGTTDMNTEAASE